VGPFIRPGVFKDFPRQNFLKASPYPWFSFPDFLTQDGFETLLKDFPGIELFEKHQDLPRGDGQRPHNRYYLAYEKSYYHDENYDGKGIVPHGALSPSWQTFLQELGAGPCRNFLAQVAGISSINLHYSWHLGVKDSEVSPHLDAPPEKSHSFILFQHFPGLAAGVGRQHAPSGKEKCPEEP